MPFLEIFAVTRYTDEVVLQYFDYLRVDESRPTIYLAIVSSTTKGVPVHDPQKEWTIRVLSEDARLHQIGMPANFQPGVFLRVWQDRGNFLLQTCCGHHRTNPETYTNQDDQDCRPEIS
jgi:hypothetical protein